MAARKTGCDLMKSTMRQRARQRLDERSARLKITPQSVTDIEKSEATGSIQLKTLSRAAEALGCTLVYALVPKTSLEGAVRKRARRIAMKDLQRVAHTM